MLSNPVILILEFGDKIKAFLSWIYFSLFYFYFIFLRGSHSFKCGYGCNGYKNYFTHLDELVFNGTMFNECVPTLDK